MALSRNKHANEYRFAQGSDTAKLIIFDTNDRPVEFLIDRDIVEQVSQYQWTLQKKTNGGAYAYRKARRADGTIMNDYLHRFIIQTPDGMMTDHISRDTSDCRRDNLRIATRKQNAQNRSVQKNSSTGVHGVIYSKRSNRYIARIWIDGKDRYLGSFADVATASIMRDLASILVYGDFAFLNNPSMLDVQQVAA